MEERGVRRYGFVKRSGLSVEELAGLTAQQESAGTKPGEKAPENQGRFDKFYRRAGDDISFGVSAPGESFAPEN